MKNGAGQPAAGGERVSRSAKKAYRFALDMALISLGFFAVGIGTSLSYRAALGSSPMATLADGLHCLLGISYGAGNMLGNLLFFLPVLVVARDTVRAGSLVCTFTLGLHIDLGMRIVPPLAESSGFPAAVAVAAAGIAVNAVGLSFYVAANAGLGAVEALTEVCSRLAGWQYKYAKIACDALFLLSGILMGGAYGAATIAQVLFMGCLMQYFIRFFRVKLPFLFSPAAAER